MEPSGAPAKVLILGGGFGGLAVAKGLSALVRSGKAEVTVVDRQPHHVFTPLLYEVATGLTRPAALGGDQELAGAAMIPLDAVLCRYGARFVCDAVAGHGEGEQRVVRLGSGQELAYDVLVVALGSEASASAVEGAAEHGYMLKTISDALRIRQRLADLVAKAKENPSATAHILLAGAGPTGVEMASELVLLLAKHLGGPLDPSRYSVTVAEFRNRPLAILQPKVSEWARERLAMLGVKLHLDTCVQHVRRAEAVIAPRPLRDGERTEDLACDFRHEKERVVPADMFIWTAGVVGSDALERLGLPVGKTVGGRIEVPPSLEVPGRSGVFVLGDSAMVRDPKTNAPAPWNAQAAMAQGKAVARAIDCRLGGGTAEELEFRTYPTVTTVGGKYGVLDAGSAFRWRGFFAWVGRKVADLDYFLLVLPPGRALSLWWRGLRLFSRND